MAKVVMTNMVMLEVADRLLVIDRIKRFKGVAFPGGKVEAGERTATDEGKVFWIDKKFLRNCTLAPYMDEYLRVYEDYYSECFCTYKDGYIPHYR